MNGQADRRERIKAALARYETSGKAKRGRKARDEKMNDVDGMGVVCISMASKCLKPLDYAYIEKIPPLNIQMFKTIKRGKKSKVTK